MLETMLFLPVAAGFFSRGFFRDLAVADYLRVPERFGVIYSSYEVFSPRALFIDYTEIFKSFSAYFLALKVIGLLGFFSTTEVLKGLRGDYSMGFSILLMLSGGESHNIRICSGESCCSRQRPLGTSSELNWILAVFSSSRIEPLLSFELNSLLKLCFLPSNDSLEILEVEKIA